jgi:hypothetical protein
MPCTPFIDMCPPADLAAAPPYDTCGQHSAAQPPSPFEAESRLCCRLRRQMHTGGARRSGSWQYHRYALINQFHTKPIAVFEGQDRFDGVMVRGINLSLITAGHPVCTDPVRGRPLRADRRPDLRLAAAGCVVVPVPQGRPAQAEVRHLGPPRRGETIQSCLSAAPESSQPKAREQKRTLRIGMMPETPDTLTAATCVVNMHRMLLICSSVFILRCAGGSHAGDPATGAPPGWHDFSPLNIR